jgi:hypothetical protein
MYTFNKGNILTARKEEQLSIGVGGNEYRIRISSAAVVIGNIN